MDIHDWLSVLIMAAVTIGIARKTNRKKTEQQPVSEDREELEDLEDLEVEVETDAAYTVQECRKEPEPPQPQEEYRMPGDYFSSLERKEEISPPSPVIEKEEEREEDEARVGFDLRRAIISSEILHRPQF